MARPERHSPHRRGQEHRLAAPDEDRLLHYAQKLGYEIGHAKADEDDVLLDRESAKLKHLLQQARERSPALVPKLQDAASRGSREAWADYAESAFRGRRSIYLGSRDPTRTTRGPRRGRGRRTIFWEEKDEGDETMIWVYVREPGAAEWAAHQNTIMGSSWEVMEPRGDFAYAAFPAYNGWLADARREYPNASFQYLPSSPPRSWLSVR